jgi:hypothetical protein
MAVAEAFCILHGMLIIYLLGTASACLTNLIVVRSKRSLSNLVKNLTLCIFTRVDIHKDVSPKYRCTFSGSQHCLFMRNIKDLKVPLDYNKMIH